MPLTDRQRKHLRGLGHALRPVVLIGQRGMAESVIQECARALHDHELIKVRARVGDRGRRDSALLMLASATGSELVQQIGNVGLLYKKNNKLSKILLPDS